VKHPNPHYTDRQNIGFLGRKPYVDAV